MSHVLIQGGDFKAKQWAGHIGSDCEFFSSLGELFAGIRRAKGSIKLVFRYQNSQSSRLSDLRYTLALTVILLLRRQLKARVFWIMHNIDRETTDNFPFLTKIRRKMLFSASEKVFVTDPYFKELFFQTNSKVESISFGRKQGGQVSTETLKSIEKRRNEFDIVVLCVGARGRKYVHFDRLGLLQAEAAKCSKRVVFIVPEFVAHTRAEVIRVAEENLDESKLRGLVDFIYRINDDFSMPFTVYAACSAGIPLISSSEFFTGKIIERYGLGFTESEFSAASKEQLAMVRKNMKRFLDDRHWNSLSEKIR